MSSFRPIFLLVLSGLGCDLGLADPAGDEPLANRIARLPWDTGVVSIDSPTAENQIVVTATYEKPGVVKDSNISTIGVQRLKTQLDQNGLPIIRSFSRTWTEKDRDGINGWCDGNGRVWKADAYGFDYLLELSWQEGNEPMTKYGKVFHCLWVKEQQFTRKGLTVHITVSMK